MNWNDQQTAAIDGILSFIAAPFNQNDPTGWAITIIGHAGTGKTTMVQEAIRQATEQDPSLQICVTAPTNKATQVLANFGRDAGINVDTMTIYSLLGLVLGENGEVKTVFQGGNGSFTNYDVVIIDEGSMVGSLLMDIVSERALKYGIKVIFMGDHCQLNPVKESQSRVFNRVEVPNQYKLDKIMRQDEGSPIRQTIASFREFAQSGQVPPKISTNLTPREDGVHVMIGQEFYDAMLYQFDCEEYKEDPTFCRALAWTNAEVDRMNRMIRRRLYGENCEDYMLGERVAVLAPVMDECMQQLICTDDECEIVSIGLSTLTDKADFETLPDGHPQYKTWLVGLKNFYGEIHYVHVLHRDDLGKHKRRLDHLSREAKAKRKPWKMFWSCKELFTPIRPIHAMTIHKSQGQTFNTVFVNVRDAMNNMNTKERARLMYVAGSRATTNLVLNKPRVS